MEPPRVTFVVPCFNHGRFVGEAVASALAQRDAEVRVVVVNDGSTDGSTPAACDACAGDRVRVVHQPNAGLPAARNRGARDADTEFLAFLDADDWVEPEFAARLAHALRGAGPEASHAYCYERLGELGNDWIWRTPEWDGQLMLLTNLHPVTALLRRSCFEALGGFDATMREGYEDWEFWIRCAGRGWRGVRVPEPLFVWRRHSRETMIADAVGRHDRLVAQIIERNRELYLGRAEALLKRASSMLCRYEANWLDENLDAIQHAFKRDRAEYLERELWATRAVVERLEAQVQAEAARTAEARAAGQRREGELLALLEEQSRALRSMREAYESMAVVRLHHRVHRLVGVLPAPLARAGRGALRWSGDLVRGFRKPAR